MTTPIGIAQIVHSLEVGGMERVVLHLATHLDRRQWRPTIVCLTIRGEFAELAEKEGVEVIALGKKPGVDLSLPFKVSKILKDRNIRLIHGHNSGPWFTGTLASLAGRIGPVVVTDHSRAYPEKMSVRMTECLLSRFVTVVSVSNENKERLSKNLWIPEGKIRVIPNGVVPVARPTEERLAELRKEFGIGEGDFVFLCAARLEAQKGHEVLIDASRLLADKGLPVRVLIAGAGSRENDLKNMIAEKGLAERVRLLGRRMDVGDIYGIADVFVMSSHWEGLPMAALEAMSAGLPIVSTRVGDIPDAVIDGKNGFLLPPNDPAALAEGMEKTFRMGESLKTFSAFSREHFRENFSVERMIEHYEKLYEELL